MRLMEKIFYDRIIPKTSVEICFDAISIPYDVNIDDDTPALIYDDATCRIVYKTM